MRPRVEPASRVRLHYAPGALLSAAVIAGGVLGLETVLHARHALAPVSVPGVLEAMKGMLGLPVWEILHKASYAVYIAPLLLAMRMKTGAVKRLLIGSAALVAIGGGFAVLPVRWLAFELVPCLLVANSVFVLACLARHRFFGPATMLAAGVTLLVALATALTRRHDVLDLALGLIAGYAAYRLAHWKELWFFERFHPWQIVDFELRGLWNLLVRNSRRNWELTYAAGRWDFLESAAQKPRHYVIAGAVVDQFPEGGARVLDVGCGHATLYPLLRGRIAAYTGLDLSDKAIRSCRAKLGTDADAQFVQAPFEDYCPREKYDVVVLNEVLYYFPRRQAHKILRKAASLAADGGVVIVSMNRNWKAGLIWRTLPQMARPAQSLKATNLKTGSYWTINIYPAAEVG